MFRLLVLLHQLSQSIYIQNKWKKDLKIRKQIHSSRDLKNNKKPPHWNKPSAEYVQWMLNVSSNFLFLYLFWAFLFKLAFLKVS